MNKQENWQLFCDYKGTIIRLSGEEIYFICSEQRKTYVYTKEKSYQINVRLNEVEQMLEGLPIVRTHCSFLVNLNHMQCLDGFEMHMNNGCIVPISERRRKNVYQQVRSYLFTPVLEQTFRIVKNAVSMIDLA